MNEILHPDGRVELRDTSRIERSPLYNHDLAPVPLARRTWSTYNYAALWISMAHCIPTYMLASGLMASGMNWWQALVTILLGNTIVLVPILLNSHPGTKYGIPFPVFARVAYGTIGSNLPALMRALVACGWFGIQAWIGGEALQTFFAALIPGWPQLLGSGFAGHTTTEWLSFLLFWSLNVFIIYRGMDLLRWVENWAAPFVLVMTTVLLVWAVQRANGLGPLLAQPGKLNTFGEFFPVFIPSLTAMIGYWATLSLNMPDFTRFGRSQREQIVGQVVALPTTMSVFAAMGVLITSATVVIYGEAIWDPVKLVGRFDYAARRRGLDVHGRRRDARRQHRRQRRLAGQRFRQRVPAAHRLQDRRADHGPAGDPDAAVEAARRSVGLHLHVAARLLRRPGLDRRRAHRRLLDRPRGRRCTSRISI